jgi:hypothetical protein
MDAVTSMESVRCTSRNASAVGRRAVNGCWRTSLDIVCFALRTVRGTPILTAFAPPLENLDAIVANHPTGIPRFRVSRPIGMGPARPV